MIRYILAVILILIGCGSPIPERTPQPLAAVTTVAAVVSPPVFASAPCLVTARSLGALPDDAVDDRAALQALLTACAGKHAKLEGGVYRIETPPGPRIRASLTMAENTTLSGLGQTMTELRFVGDNGKKDFVGIQAPSTSYIHHVRITNDFVVGSTAEQTHLIRVDGPATTIHFEYINCNHPERGTKTGDCFQLVGYPPKPDGTQDKRIWDVEINNVVIEWSDRSGIAFHSGVHGRVLPNGHYSTRFHHIECGEVSDQCLDGEGGDGDTDHVEIDHLTFTGNTSWPRTGLSSIQIQNSSNVWVHDNTLVSIDIGGCNDCLFEDNKISLTMPLSPPAITFRKYGDNTTFRNERYERAVSAGIGTLMTVAQSFGVPTNVHIEDSKLIQHTDTAAILMTGIVGIHARGLSIKYDGTDGRPPKKGIDAIGIFGSGSAGCPVTTPPGIRTSDIHMVNGSVEGPLRSALFITGSYCGAGTLEFTRTSVTGTAKGIWCENIGAGIPGPTGAGITGPFTVTDNIMPASSCVPLIP